MNCGGGCTQLGTREDCGGCGDDCDTWSTTHSLPDDYFATCYAELGVCGFEKQYNDAVSCATLCASIGGAAMHIISRELPDGIDFVTERYIFIYITLQGAR